MGLVDSTSLFLLKGDHAVWYIVGRRRGRLVHACFSFPLVDLDGRDSVMAVLRSADDHVHSATIIVVSFVVMPSSVFFA